MSQVRPRATVVWGFMLVACDGGGAVAPEAGVVADAGLADGGLDGATGPDAPGADASISGDGGDAGDLRDAGDGPPSMASDAGGEPWLERGVWIAGWSGGLIHESWLRFDPDAGGGRGRLSVRHVRCGACVGYFSCEGTNGRYTWTGDTVVLELPPACGTTPVTFRLGAPRAPTTTGIAGADFEVAVRDASKLDFPLTMTRLPRSRCDEAFTTCMEPHPF